MQGYLLLIAYLIVINIIGLIIFGADKLKARRQTWRIPERVLLLIAVFGGSVGCLFGMKLFHHKTRHKKFHIGLPLILLLQILVTLVVIALKNCF